MAKTNMDDMEALIGLGVLGAILNSMNPDGTPKKATFGTSVKQQSTPDIDGAARETKKMYDSYVKAGFTEDQAFRLTETALAGVKTVKLVPANFK